MKGYVDKFKWQQSSESGEIKEIGYGAPSACVMYTCKFIDPVTILQEDSTEEQNRKINEAIEKAGGFKWQGN